MATYKITEEVRNNQDTHTLELFNGTSYDNVAIGDLSLKVDKITGKGLSTEDYTSAEKNKLANVPNDTNSALSSKQDTLLSGTNIKTINGDSVLGNGNLIVGGGVLAESTSYFLDPQVQTNIPTNTTNVDGQTVERIWWNVVDKTDPNILYNPTTATFNLKAGGRYRVTYQVNARYNASSIYQSGVFNYTTNQYEQVSYHTTQTTIQADQIVAGHRRMVGTAIIDTTAGARNIGIAFTGSFGIWNAYFDSVAFAPLTNAQMAKWNNITIERISGNIPINPLDLIVTPISVNTTLTLGNLYVATNNITCTLPTAIGNKDKSIVVFRQGTNNVIIAPTLSQTINGDVDGITLVEQYASVKLTSDNANWILN